MAIPPDREQLKEFLSKLMRALKIGFYQILWDRKLIKIPNNCSLETAHNIVILTDYSVMLYDQKITITPGVEKW
jgi:hypothetical protein